MTSKDMIICRCEEVSLGKLLDLAQQQRCSARELKLRTRAGMGFCGGRTCRCLIDQIIEQITGKNPADNITLKYQPPVRPVSFEQLGGYK